MTEANLQSQCVMWFNQTHRNIAMLVHIPNAREQSAKDAAWWRGQGVVPGWPDLMVVHAGRCLLIELKTDTGKLSAAQVTVHERLRKQGNEVHVVRSLEGFQELVNGWLG